MDSIKKIFEKEVVKKKNENVVKVFENFLSTARFLKILCFQGFARLRVDKNENEEVRRKKKVRKETDLKDEELLTIHYPRGTMVIYMPRFFPASSGTVRKLFLKTISLADDSADLADKVVAFLREEIAETGNEETLKGYADAAVSAHTKASEMQEDIDRQSEKVERLRLSKPKGQAKEVLKNEKEALKVLKERQKSFMGDFRWNRKQFEDRKTRAKKLSENLELIEELTERWR